MINTSKSCFHLALGHSSGTGTRYFRPQLGQMDLSKSECLVPQSTHFNSPMLPISKSQTFIQVQLQVDALSTWEHN